jgi:hypothetical protein
MIRLNEPGLRSPGETPASVAEFSALRAGHVTTAILRGESAHNIMTVTGRASWAVVDKYFARSNPCAITAARSLGLSSRRAAGPQLLREDCGTAPAHQLWRLDREWRDSARPAHGF